jgi:hypothetical protein
MVVRDRNPDSTQMHPKSTWLYMSTHSCTQAAQQLNNGSKHPRGTRQGRDGRGEKPLPVAEKENSKENDRWKGSGLGSEWDDRYAVPLRRQS